MAKTSCKDCIACEQLYTRTRLRFWRCSGLFCAAHERFVSAEDGCSEWQPKKTDYDVSAERFDKATEDIEYMTDCYETGE